MMQTRAHTILLLLLLLHTLCCVRADYITKVTPHTSWGVWEGWGCSVAWWGKAFGERDDLADLIFTNKTVTLNGVPLPGLHMNIARYNAGACSWNTYQDAKMVVSPNMYPARQMEGFWVDWESSDPSSKSWNWSVDANQRSLIKKAQTRGANLFELFSNSPMWWMCINHNPSGADNGNNDNLQNWNYKQHAYYLATVALFMKNSMGITFDSVEPFNEPMGNWWSASGNQEGCHFAESTQAEVIPYMRQALDAYNLTSMKVSASDENTYDQALHTWESFSEGVQKDVARVNTHGYQYGGGQRDKLYAAVSGKAKLWNSEYGEGDGTGLSLASNLNLDFRWLHNTAWVYWQPFDGGGWGFIDADISTNHLGAPNKKYYVMAQYTRHVRPGMLIIDGGEANTIAAYDSTASKLVIVSINYDNAQKISYDLSAFTSVKGPITRWETDIKGSINYTMSTDAVLKGNTFTVSFNTNTIQTFEVQGVRA